MSAPLHPPSSAGTRETVWTPSIDVRTVSSKKELPWINSTVPELMWPSAFESFPLLRLMTTRTDASLSTSTSARRDVIDEPPKISRNSRILPGVHEISRSNFKRGHPPFARAYEQKPPSRKGNVPNLCRAPRSREPS